MYELLFRELSAECSPDSPLAGMLGGSERAVHDAIPLRLAGAVHACVLRGEAPSYLSRHYPTMGGSPSSTLAADFLTYVFGNESVISQELQRNVQTNEIRRGVVLREMQYWLSTLSIEDFDLLEIGASAGLNLLFDKYPDEWFPTIASTSRPIDSSRSVPATARSRTGCDPFPVDIKDPVAVTRLKSFVWPDQIERHHRLDVAITIAQQHQVHVAQASADTWLSQHLPNRSRPTVVFHSIVWQYLGDEVQRTVRELLTDHGSRSATRGPLVWLRMEPNGAMADVRATVWHADGTRTEHVLADVGYHGDPFVWRI